MEDVAITFGTIVGPDPADPLTERYFPIANVPSNYTQFLDVNGLQVCSEIASQSCQLIPTISCQGHLRHGR